MLGCGETLKEAIRPDFNRAIMIDFQGATISSDTGFILLREVDERFKIIDPMKDCLEDLITCSYEPCLGPDGAPKDLPDSCRIRRLQ
jgi:hypothetical protein